MSSDEDPRYVLGYLLKHAQRDFEAATTAALAPLGVDGRDFGVLRVLDAQVPRSQQDVAQLLGVDRTTMVALLDGLEAKAIVSRHPHVDDRRRNVVELTESGRRLLRRAARAYDKAEQAYLAPLGEQGAQQLMDSLTALVTEWSGSGVVVTPQHP